MIDLKMLDETFARLRRIAEQNQETASFALNMVHDMYELPKVQGKGRQLIPGDNEFILAIQIPLADVPEGAVRVPRVDVAKRMQDAQAGEFNGEEE